ncbi:hypothetical protein BV898_10759 [Hypsibius exemplaris]|uniref:Uncharacterized protein n=1 Tax=Hypsibius exemplaris TaxID=2072580 RepID=A0A1W0WIJ3_HYPEX|nr:hypothetical protein BV898_10759 [Hypsibius exemplaris]
MDRPGHAHSWLIAHLLSFEGTVVTLGLEVPSWQKPQCDFGIRRTQAIPPQQVMSVLQFQPSFLEIGLVVAAASHHIIQKPHAQLLQGDRTMQPQHSRKRVVLLVRREEVFRGLPARLVLAPFYAERVGLLDSRRK